jgi:hypothetical protein
VAPTWTLPGSNAAQPTDTEPSITSTIAGPTKSVEGNEKSASTSEGAASVNVAGGASSWLILVGLGLGITF